MWWRDFAKIVATDHPGLTVFYGLTTFLTTLELIVSPWVFLKIVQYLQRGRYRHGFGLFLSFLLSFVVLAIADGLAASKFEHVLTTSTEKVIITHLLEPHLIDDNSRGTWIYSSLQYAEEIGRFCEMLRSRLLKPILALIGSNIIMWDRQDTALNLALLVQLLGTILLPWVICRRTYWEQSRLLHFWQNVKIDYLDDIFQNRKTVVAHGTVRQTIQVLTSKTKQSSDIRDALTCQLTLEAVLPALVLILVTSFIFIARIKQKLEEKKVSVDILKVMFSVTKRSYHLGIILQSVTPVFFNYTAIQNLQSHLLSTATPVPAGLATKAVNTSAGLSFHRVTFRYGTREIVSDFSFDFPNNNITAVVGQSGSGKTTILNLIQGMLMPTQGYITLNNIPLNQIPNRHQLIGSVFQQPQLFNTTVWENIGYGLACTRDQVMEKLKAADNFACLEMVGLSLDQSVGKNGENLSGGQRQIVQLLRVVLADPPVLLLDEPTAALDSQSSDAVMELIERNTLSKIVVIITHDPRILKYAHHHLNLA